MEVMIVLEKHEDEERCRLRNECVFEAEEIVMSRTLRRRQ